MVSILDLCDEPNCMRLGVKGMDDRDGHWCLEHFGVPARHYEDNGLDIAIPHDEYMLALYLACWFGPPNEVMGFLLDRAAMAAMGDCCPSAYAVYLEETGRG